METKICTICKEERTINLFSKHIRSKDGLHHDCKICASEYRKKNREKRHLYNLDYRSKNQEKVKEIHRQYRIKNKEIISQKAKIYRLKPEVRAKEKISNKKYEITDKAKAYHKKYREENREIYSNSVRKYYQKNKEAIQQKHRDRMANDPLYRMKRKIRDAIKNALAKKGYSKNGRTQEILGCDYDFFIQYMEAQFKDGMNWTNASIDHIKPLYTAKTENDIILLNHYTNLQPLFVPENSSKSNKLITKQLRLI